MENSALRNRSGFWIETACSYSATNEKGFTKTINEKYVVEAVDFGQAESRLRKEMDCANRKIKVKSVVRPKYGEICFNENANTDEFFKVKVQISEEVEVHTRKGGTRTKTKVRTHEHLVQASSDAGARTAIHECVYKGSTEDWEIIQITKTKILGVLENDKHLANLEDEKAAKMQKDDELKK